MKTYNIVTTNGSFRIQAKDWQSARTLGRMIVRGENKTNRAKKDKVEKVLSTR